METLINEIVTKLNDLPEARLREVLQFVDRLKQSNPNSERTHLSEEPLLSIAGMLSGEPLSVSVIEAELYDS